MIITDMTMNDFAAGLEQSRTVFIPFGSTEEHGFHLPLATDTFQVYEVLKRVVERIAVFVAPPVHYGVCRSTANHSGTIGISADTLRSLVKDLVGSFYRQGLRSFILISGHAGKTHMSALVEVGELLLELYGDIKIAVICEYDLAREVCREEVETADDSHAGEIETSRILHSSPELVYGTSPAEYPDFPRFMLVRNKQSYWKNGVWGDPGKATREKGKRYYQLVADRLVAFVQEMEQFKERH
ncbi:MAG: creatininase family protein [Deltaproteobacteria bacterium]|nr:creatininase family protein [Candidatus Anaeroferrophillus wilburensis]MBN2888203.1 creatininase family protein [Deltaproteobacteria bacterium]